MRSTRTWSSNRRTIQSYTESAREYDGQVSARPPIYIARALRRMVKHVPAGGLILEVGSGTGRDADFIESRVLRKIRRALQPGGVFLTAVWTGTGQTDGRYHMTYWSRTAFKTRLTAAGLTVEWDSCSVARGGKTLLTFLARRLP